jgi:hypothetical protein
LVDNFEATRKYGCLELEQAAKVWQAEIEVKGLVKAEVVKVVRYSAVNTLLAPEMWENLARVLLLDGQPVEAELDWDKVAKYINELIKQAAVGNSVQPKPLNKGETRKAALTATRARNKLGRRQLAAAKSDPEKAAAKDICTQAMMIFKRQGWKVNPSKRAVKAKAPDSGPSGKKVKANDGENSGNGKSGDGAPLETKQPAPEPPAPTSPVQPQNPPADKGSSSTGRFYLTGKTYPVLDEIKKAGGKFDSKLKQWWLPDAVTLAEVQKLVDAQDYSSKKGSKEPAK